VDSLTHALAASIIFALIGHPELVPFAALGAVCPDVDVIFQRFSDRDPGLYIFTHGGITHSIAGALTTSVVVTVPGLIVATLLGHGVAFPLAFAAAAAGVLTHIALDFLAYPGIPLLYPATDRKYTLGISAGPTPYLLVASIAYGAFLLAGKAGIGDPWAYVGFFAIVIAMAVILKAYVTARSGSMAIPGFNPMKWLIVADTPDSYRISSYHLLRGRTPAVEFEKFSDIRPEEIDRFRALPEVKRMRYHSYIVTAHRNGETITFTDPLRENGYLWYPPYYKSLGVSDGARFP
jgi:Predicted membrane-bound metal-dependent hydrolases